MIWVGGRIVPDDALSVSVLDRAFEHGLGLFETLRTWDGRAPLLERHLARMKRSARELGLPYGPVTPPDADAVARLVEAEGIGGDVLLRLTLSGGTGESAGAKLWMRALPLPPPIRREGAVVDLGTWEVNLFDPLARYKSLNYWSRRRAYEASRAIGFDEVLSVSGPYGKTTIWEGSRTNLFAVRGGDLLTPSTSGPIVPGVMRALVIERASKLAMPVIETDELERAELARCDEVFLTNSVRGVIPVARLIPTWRAETHDWPVPGDWTRRLAFLVSEWLERGEAPQ